MSNTLKEINRVSQQVITITEVASIAINAIVITYKFIDVNKEKYREFFETVLRYMDAMEIKDSPLTGKEKKEAVLMKVKEVALELLFDWDKIKDVISSLIDDAKNIYNQMLSTKNSITDRLKTIKM